MAVPLNSLINFSSMFPGKSQLRARTCIKTTAEATPFALSLGIYGSRVYIKDKKWVFSLSVADSDQIAADTSKDGSGKDENSLSDDHISASSFPQKDTISSPGLKSKMKRSPLTAREKLRAARVLTRNTETKTSKSEFGSNVLDVMREGDKGKKRSRLPEAPTNLFDDSKRGVSKQGLVFEFPGGIDVFFIVLSVVLISTVMFTTTYIVWKAGAIHFNEY